MVFKIHLLFRPELFGVYDEALSFEYRELTANPVFPYYVGPINIKRRRKGSRTMEKDAKRRQTSKKTLSLDVNGLTGCALLHANTLVHE